MAKLVETTKDSRLSEMAKVGRMAKMPKMLKNLIRSKGKNGQTVRNS